MSFALATAPQSPSVSPYLSTPSYSASPQTALSNRASHTSDSGTVCWTALWFAPRAHLLSCWNGSRFPCGWPPHSSGIVSERLSMRELSCASPIDLNVVSLWTQLFTIPVTDKFTLDLSEWSTLGIFIGRGISAQRNLGF